MKNLLVIALLSCSIAAQAQNVAKKAVPSQENESAVAAVASIAPKKQVLMVDASQPFKYADINVTGDALIIENVPDVPFTAYITNAAGKVLMTRRVAANNRMIDIHGIPQGLHYLTIMSGDTRKAFVVKHETILAEN